MRTAPKTRHQVIRGISMDRSARYKGVASEEKESENVWLEETNTT
jgi:hypothetical protein